METYSAGQDIPPGTRVGEAQARATTAWPEDSLLLTSKPEALGGWPAAKDTQSSRGGCCLRTIANGDREESVNSKHWGGLLGDFTLSGQGSDLISFEGENRKEKEKKKNIHFPNLLSAKADATGQVNAHWSSSAHSQCLKQ